MNPITTPRGSKGAFITFLALSLGVAGAGCGSPTQPSAASTVVNLTGTWSGSASDSSGPGQMTWQMTQTGSSCSGTLTMTDAGANINGRGSVSGSISGPSIRFALSVPAGGFDSPYTSCSADVSGDAQVSGSSITGTYSGANSCTGAVASGHVTLTRSG